MNEIKTMRWHQRLQNLDKAFSQLERGLDIEYPSDIERQGIIQSFELNSGFLSEIIKTGITI
jgi:hypothetical protein